MASAQADDRLSDASRLVSIGGGKPGTPPGELQPGPSAPNPIFPERVRALQQLNHVATGFDEFDVPLPVPSIDPAGVVYHAGLGGLLIADSEITEIAEVFNIVGATVFLTSTTVATTWAQWDISEITGVEPAPNSESTGIAYCESSGDVYVTNDDLDLIFRYQFDGMEFRVVDFVSTSEQTGDPEGITCDPVTGTLYVIGGIEANIIVYTYNGGFVFQRELELEDTAGHPDGVLADAEGIAFDAVTQHLFVVSDPAEKIVEYDLDGHYVNSFDLSNLSPSPIAPQGLTIGPASIDPDRSSFFVADGGLDNDQVPSERDGAIYELLIVRIGDDLMPLGGD